VDRYKRWKGGKADFLAGIDSVQTDQSFFVLERSIAMDKKYFLGAFLAALILAGQCYAQDGAANSSQLGKQLDVCMLKVEALEKEMKEVKEAVTLDSPACATSAAVQDDDPWWFEHPEWK